MLGSVDGSRLLYARDRVEEGRQGQQGEEAGDSKRDWCRSVEERGGMGRRGSSSSMLEMVVKGGWGRGGVGGRDRAEKATLRTTSSLTISSSPWGPVKGRAAYEHKRYSPYL
jgi:hypothetical protein